MTLTEELFLMQDLKYREFHAKLMPTVNIDRIIGIRTPILRKFSKEFNKRNDEVITFLADLPHKYYEENNLHAFLIEQIKDFDTALDKTEAFLPYIDNWATCDMFLPKIFKKNHEKMLPKIYEWLKSDKTYTVRYALGLLLNIYLDTEFRPEFLEKAASIKSDEYYVNMMISWYFATALAKQYKSTIPYLTDKRLNKWVHNKTIQKATESYRITPETKAYLKTLKIK